MRRSTRVAVGSVVTFVLVLVAAVSALVWVVAAAQSRDDAWSSSVADPDAGEFFMDPVTTQAEVLDVDGEGEGWVSVDVRFATEDGDEEIAYLDLGEGAASAEVGDTIEIVYERSDPRSVLRADDPILTETTLDDGPDALPPPDQREAAAAVARRIAVLALVSLVGAVVAGVLTVVAVRRAPAESVVPETIQA